MVIFPRHHAALYAASLALTCWLAGFAAFTFHIATMKHETDRPVDAIIVLTGGAGRIGYGLDLLAAHQAEQLFITGVNSRVDMNAIHSLWKGDNHDLITCCVTLGIEARNTRQNAREARKWINGVQGIESALLVTSSYHMPRALLEFRQAMPDLAIDPAPVAYGKGRDHDKRSFWGLAFAEYNKTLLTWVRVTLTPSRRVIR